MSNCTPRFRPRKPSAPARHRFRSAIERLEERVILSLTVTPTQDANTLIQTILGADVTARNVVLVSNGTLGSTSTGPSTGTFSGGTDAANNVGIASGIILSSGAAKKAEGPNSSAGISTPFGTAGDADLAAAIPNTYQDASSLQFEFTAVGSRLQVEYVVASEEYEEYINYADAFAFLLQDLTAGGGFRNVALLPGGTTPVSIGTVNQNQNTSFYRSNNFGSASNTIDTQYDGMTTVLTAGATLTPGHDYRFKFVIADKGDTSMDSSVFIKANSFTTSATLPSVVVDTPYSQQLSSTNVPMANSFMVTSGTLPAGLTLDPLTGLLTGTPTIAGASTFAVEIRNPTGASDVIFYSLTVRPPEADLQLSITDGQTETTNGAQVSYTMIVNNAGPSPADRVLVGGDFSPSLTGVTWTAVATAGISLPAASGSGNIVQEIPLIPSGGLITYTVTGTVATGAAGTVESRGSTNFLTTSTSRDPDTSNNSATDSTTIVPSADLLVTKTDGQTTASVGETLTYTVIVANPGPSNVTGARVTDTFPADLGNVSWIAAFGGGATGTTSGTGNINQAVNLPSGGSVTYTVTGTVSQTAVVGSTLVNTASVALPAGVVDPNPSNNSDTDSNTITRVSDLRITQTDHLTVVTAGTAVTYTIALLNDGPADITGATVTDTFPTDLSGLTIKGIIGSAGASWALTTGPLGGQTLSDTVTIPGGGAIYYLVSGTLDPSATGTLSNTATVAAPMGTTDPDLSNNSATETSTIQAVADLEITTSATSLVVTPGDPVLYQFTVSNTGPSNAPGSTVNHAIPSDFLNANWTAVFSGGGMGTTSGSGNIMESIDLPAGASVTYTVGADVDPGATSPVTITGNVAAATGVTDPVASNNDLIVAGTVDPHVDLAVLKSIPAPPVAGSTVTYVMQVVNFGPSTATDARFQDIFPTELSGMTWTAVVAGGASVANASGSGDIDELVTVPPGGSVTYTATGTLANDATGISNSALIQPGLGFTELNASNNLDTVTVPAIRIGDLAVQITDGKTTAVPGEQNTYTVSLTNTGPSDVTGASLVMPFPISFTGVTWLLTSMTGGATGTPNGSGALLSTVDLPVGSTLTYTVVGTIAPSATGVLELSASLRSVGAGEVPDPDLSNNRADDLTTLTPQAELIVTNTHNQATVVPGVVDGLSYTITVSNTGPSNAPDTRIVDRLPVDLGGITWTAIYTGGASGPASGTGLIDELIDLPSGATVTYIAVGTVNPAARGSLANTVTAIADTSVTDPDLGNNSATDSVDLTPQVELAVTKTDGQVSAVPGTMVSYTIVVSNTGPSSTVNGRLVDLLPADLQNPGYTVISGGTGAARVTSPGSGTGHIDELFLLNPGGTLTFTVTGLLAASARGTLSNTATVSAALDETETDPSNNSATDTSSITPAVDLSVTKSAAAGPIRVGESLTYTVIVSNAGPSDATNILLQDMLPPGMVFVSASEGSASESGGVVSINLGSMASGDSTTITLLVRPTAAGSTTNTVVVSGTEQDTDPTNDSASVDVTVLCSRIGADYDGDGAEDLALYSYDPVAGRGRFDILLSTGGSRVVMLGGEGDIPVVGDFDGDRIADPAVFRPNVDLNGDGSPDAAGWSILQSSTNQTREVLFGAPSGIDLPAPADYDGDGITDIATFRPTATALDLANFDPEGDGIGAQWFLLQSTAGATRIEFGAPNFADLPAPADYDGDGEADIATFRPSSDLTPGAAEWFIRPSSKPMAGYRVAFGAPGGADLAVPLDYDGDCLADIATYRPQSDLVFGAAEWFISRPAQAIVLGSAGELAAPGDYDGDGLADLTVFDRASSRWQIRPSSGGAIREETFGPSSMTVVASSVVPVLAPLPTRLLASGTDVGRFTTAAQRANRLEVLDLALAGLAETDRRTG
ncbi:choice-of-anchor L domain-containing protein [Tautonia rosea]|uniref:choice-of-anchor L domain-containing protein n=1 Tax=Tautonia rosea TaxID=2728037 RepID=UPI001473D374|nr:choice-of-anchor L domain-containing protein [Tautonia rosea]